MAVERCQHISASCSCTRSYNPAHPISVALGPGTRLGAYDILSHLGAGGMGEVYRARDTKLGREIALKLLPSAFTTDLDRVARFKREAQLLASLNHPHIGAIYGLDEANGTQFLVLELVDGESLDKRIARGRIPVDEALGIAKQIAEAFEAAHEKGIIHRDLKPANVALTQDGQVKVLDFGLAKATETAAGSTLDVTNSPTITSPIMTSVGTIVGTATYMSPEQARGVSAERASDVWAFGCVVYELITGRAAFGGNTVSDVLAAVLKEEPDWSRLPAAIQPRIRALLRRCLQKDRRQRWRDIGDVRIEIDDALADPRGATHQTSVYPLRRWGWIATLAAGLAIGVGATAFRSSPLTPEMRVEITTPPTADAISFALSPDAQELVFVAASDKQSRLWLRALNAEQAHVLSGADDASFPFWSPDGRSIGFFADGKLKSLDIETGALRVLVDAPDGRGATWNRAGVILFAETVPSPIYRLNAPGTPAIALTHVSAPLQAGHRFPQFLPDGHHFIFFATGLPGGRGVYVADLDGGEPVRLLDTDAAAVFWAPNFLIFPRRGALFAQQFAAEKPALVGEPFQVAQGVASDEATWATAASASAVGPIVYRSGEATHRQLVWFDRAGKQMGRVATTNAVSARDPERSPDGQRIAIDRTMNGTNDIWVIDSARDVVTRVTSEAGTNVSPVWFPMDGRWCTHRIRRKVPPVSDLTRATRGRQNAC